jgi:hypothetical protein
MADFAPCWSDALDSFDFVGIGAAGFRLAAGHSED